MSYESGLGPLRQVQLSRLSPVMWSLPGGYPRRNVSIPINRKVGLGIDSGLVPAMGGAILILVALPVLFFFGVAALGVLGNVTSGREPFEY